MQSKPQNSFLLQAQQNQAGFSLIEILVGLVIGLLATLVIMQVFSVFEGQKRTTTGSADAQTNGSIALYSIEHEMKMAGFGLLPTASATPLGCTTMNYGTTGMTSMSPVVITDGGTLAGASDSITIHYANSAFGGVPTQIAGPPGTPGPSDVALNSNLGCQVGDIAMVVNGTSCGFTNVIAASVSDNATIGLKDPTIVPAANSTNYTLSCIGAWFTSIFRVNPNYDPTNATNSQAYMEKATDPAAAGEPVVSDIVNIQAQYGISNAPNSNQVTQWVDAKDGQASGDWGPSITVANRNRIKAIHIAVVARSGLYEKAVVTKTCTTAKGTVNNGPCAWDDSSVDPAPKIDLSNDTDPITHVPTWQHYRYRVFDTVIPLRNVIWAATTL
jgi:type IV pilus assembly protein PilW